MLLLTWLVPLLLGAVALAALARRVGVPYPVFLALGGAVLAVLPAGPRFALEPDLALALFVAPVLLDSAYDASVRDLRVNWLPISVLVVAAVVFTTGAVALVAHGLRPDLPWAAAIALGAIVAPPDATAAAAILRQVRLPLRISTILEGESLLNDASALFIYRIAVGVVAAGALQPRLLLTSLVLVLPLSLAAGWLIAQVTTRVVNAIEHVPSSIIIQFTLTFGVWILAERLDLSAVLVIVAYAFTIANRRNARFGARLRLPAFAVWETVTFLLNVLAFVLIGLQLRPILDDMPEATRSASLGFAVTVLVVCIAARIAWVVGFQFLRLKPVGLGRRAPPSAITNAGTIRGGLVIGWSGMRGIVTLAAAFALPDGHGEGPAFPHRELMLLTAFVVVLGTLVLQGLTLKPLLRWVDLRDDDPVGREIGHARTETVRAAFQSLDGDPSVSAELLRMEYAARLQEAEHNPDGFAPAHTEQDNRRLRAIEASRARLFDLRASGVIGNVAFQRIEAELDQAEMHATTID